MDMRTGVAFSEDYAGLGTAPSDVTRLMLASAFVPTPPGYAGPDGLYAFVATIGKNGVHGGDFVYRSPNTLVLGWILERVTGLPLARQIEQRFWSTMGMEQDAYLAVDRLGTGYGAGGLGTSLRDLARFGEMIRLGGRWNGRQIIPPAAAAAIFAPGDTAAFAAAKYPSLDGGSYASQWWHRASGQLLALGIYGQGIYVDRKAELVIVRYASHPVASNRSLLPTTLASYDAIAAVLTGRRASAPPPR
jgi:CubicO group peptidase (beta-lactamase class C family)